MHVRKDFWTSGSWRERLCLTVGHGVCHGTRQKERDCHGLDRRIWKECVYEYIIALLNIHDSKRVMTQQALTCAVEYIIAFCALPNYSFHITHSYDTYTLTHTQIMCHFCEAKIRSTSGSEVYTGSISGNRFANRFKIVSDRFR